MSIRCSFMDNQTYGADDINYALSRLTTQGISLFRYSDGDNPLLSLNEAVASFTEPGVDFFNTDACMVTYNNTTDTFMISTGTAFMYDGAFISFEDEGYDITKQVHELRKESEDKITVYLYRNVPENNIDILLTTDDTEIDTEKSVLLASIDTNNNIFDLRSFAQTKIAPTSANIVKTDTTPLFTAYSGDETETRKRATYSQVFSGAKYCFCFGRVFEIQKVATETDDGLTYTNAPLASSDKAIDVAFNMHNGKLHLWATGALYGSYAPSSQLYIF